jgi:hypothetical protein
MSNKFYIFFYLSAEILIFKRATQKNSTLFYFVQIIKFFIQFYKAVIIKKLILIAVKRMINKNKKGKRMKRYLILLIILFVSCTQNSSDNAVSEAPTQNDEKKTETTTNQTRQNTKPEMWSANEESCNKLISQFSESGSSLTAKEVNALVLESTKRRSMKTLQSCLNVLLYKMQII